MQDPLAFSAGFSVGHVALTVNDARQTASFYQKAVGLEILVHDGEVIRLGAGGNAFLELRQDKHARRRSSREAGLFHTAFLLPSRPALARWINHAIEQKLPLVGASDHDVSEALYLSDPEGNGVEIYVDRPASTWVWKDGMVRMGTAPLDIPSLLQAAQGTRWEGAPHETRVGHVHLQVGALDLAEEFYARKLGLDITCRYPGGTFYAADGYHHHIATNIWNSRGAGRRGFPSTGLAEVGFLQTQSVPKELMERAVQNPSIEDVTVEDPWGTLIKLQARKAL